MTDTDWPEVEARLRAQAKKHARHAELFAGYYRAAQSRGEGTEWDVHSEEQQQIAADLLAALARIEALTPPAGWVLVPREPTEDMLTAAELTDHWDDWRDNWTRSWRAMLAAAPAPPSLAPTEPTDG